MVYTEFTKAFFSFIMTPVVTVHAVSYKRKGRLFCADFHEASKYTTTICAHVIYRIKLKSEKKCGFFFSVALWPNVDHGLLILEVS